MSNNTEQAIAAVTGTKQQKGRAGAVLRSERSQKQGDVARTFQLDANDRARRLPDDGVGVGAQPAE